MRNAAPRPIPARIDSIGKPGIPTPPILVVTTLVAVEVVVTVDVEVLVA